MKITEENSSLLLLKNTSYSNLYGGIVGFITGVLIAYSTPNTQMWSMAIGGFIAFIGLAGILMAKIIMTLTLDKESGRCVFAHKSLVTQDKKEFELRNVMELLLETREVRTTCQYRLNFLLADGKEFPVDFGYGPSSRAINILAFDPKQNKIDTAKKIANFIGVPFTYVPPA